MKYSEAKQGRTFVLRLEDGEILHEAIEQFARKNAIKSASITVIGGADKGSILIVGPKDGRADKIEKLEYTLDDVSEVTGSGTLFSDEDGNPLVHIHISCGRNNQTITGCIRNGVKVWQIMEVIIIEMIDTTAKRVEDDTFGLKLLEP